MPYKEVSKKELEIIDTACYTYLKSAFNLMPIIIAGGSKCTPVCSFVDVMVGLKKYESTPGVIENVRYGIQDIRPALDMLACKGMIYQWFEVRSNGTSIQRYMYKPTEEEIKIHTEYIFEILNKQKKIKKQKRKLLESEIVNSVNDLAMLVGGST